MTIARRATVGLATRMLLAAALGGIGTSALAQAPAPGATPVPSAAATAFDRLKGLVGTYVGRRPYGREIRVTYRLTALGSALVETWDLAPGRESMTIYHLDGAELVATHYCPQGNQPRLRMSRAAGSRFDFTFRDGTGIDSGESYQHDFWIEIGADGAITRSETYLDEVGPDTETIIYRRVAE